MRVLFTSLPATGHFNSILPLAMAVQQAGHAVAICCAPQFREKTVAMGFEHLPGGTPTFEEVFRGAPPLSGPKGMQWVQAVAFATNAAGRMLPDLTQHVDAWQPDVLVRESTEFAGLLLGELRGIPHASIATGALAARDDRRAIVADALGAWRAQLGLPPDPDATAVFRYLAFSFTPPSWDGDRPGVHAPTTHFIRHENPRLPGADAPSWLDDSRDAPLVLASLGTVMHAEAGLLEAIIEALANEPIRAVVAIGRDQDPLRFGEPPRNVRLEPFVAQIPVLEKCDLFVTHGGFNSTKEALSLGVPLVSIPIGGDQPYSAQRVEELGLGRRVGFEERTPAVIRKRVREVLAEPRYRERARAFAEEMRSLPPVSHAVRLLEQLATHRDPIPRV